MKKTGWFIALFVISLCLAIWSAKRFYQAKSVARYFISYDIAHLKRNFKSAIEEAEIKYVLQELASKGWDKYTIEKISYKDNCQSADVLIRYWSSTGKMKDWRIQTEYLYSPANRKMNQPTCFSSECIDLSSGKRYQHNTFN